MVLDGIQTLVIIIFYTLPIKQIQAISNNSVRLQNQYLQAIE